MKRTNVLVEGAILLALYIILLLITLYAPIISFITILLLATPFIIFVFRHGWKQSISLVIAACLLSFLAGTFVSVPMALMFSTTGIVMAYFYRRQRPMYSLIGGTISLLIHFVAAYAVSIVYLGEDIFTETIEQTRSTINETLELFPSLDEEAKKILAEQVNAQLNVFAYLLPSMFVVGSFILTIVIHIINQPILKRLKMNTGSLMPFRNWKFPTSIIWYYLIAVVLMFLNIPEGSFLYIALLNLVFILRTLLLIQGFSFIFYFSYVKKFSKAIPILAVVVSFFIPILLYPVQILGIVDLGFNLRDKIR